eukprot:2410808-Ditylum_brightwellii.AAC.1
MSMLPQTSLTENFKCYTNMMYPMIFDLIAPPPPRCIHTKATQAVGSYTNMLIGLANANPQEEEDKTLDTNAICSRKRDIIALTTTDYTTTGNQRPTT